MSMKLAYKEVGQGFPLMIIHGLYGSGDNWISIARELSCSYRVILPDLRNHGNSPHSIEHNYEDMVSDIKELLHDLHIEQCFMMGHSMGGKVGMKFSLTYPEIVKKLIVVDVSPRNYSSVERITGSDNDHEHIIRSLLALPLQQLDSRTAISEQLAKDINSSTLRNFLLKNIVRKGNSFEWKANLPVLQSTLAEMMGGFEGESRSCTVETLFIKGANSNYIGTEDFLLIKKLFPCAAITTIMDAGHWIHTQQPVIFLKQINYFLNTN